MTKRSTAALALDVGSKRIGVAVASLVARLPKPLTTLENNSEFPNNINEIIRAEDVGVLIVGYPRNMEGQQTNQTAEIEEFTNKLKGFIDVPVFFQDESITSKQAEAELRSRGQDYKKEDIDALAATYILQDFLENPKNLIKLNV